VIRALEPAVADNLRLLLPLDRAWQPSDYLPGLETESWRDELEEFRKAAEAVSDELLVVLVGDMVTEEALPSYSVALNGLVKDDEAPAPPWAVGRGWTGGEPPAICQCPTSVSPRHMRASNRQCTLIVNASAGEPRRSTMLVLVSGARHAYHAATSGGFRQAALNRPDLRALPRRSERGHSTRG
jgi:hypothetical protein